MDVEYIRDNYAKPITNFTAEKSELMQYIILTVSFPCIFIIFYKIMQKINLKTNKKIDNIINTVGMILLIGITYIIFSKNPRFIQKTILGHNWLAGTICILLNISLIYLYLKISEDVKYKKVELAFKYISYAVSIIIIVIISYLHINDSYAQNKYSVYHFDAYFYPIYKILSGLTQGIDFNSIYGGYSYIFSAIMNLFGTTSIFSFSIIIAVLVCISFVCISVFLNKIIKNKVVCILSLLSCIHVLITQSFLDNNSVYLQYTPHRILFPTIMLVYMLLYFKYRNTKFKNILQLLGFIISTFAIFWNLETGLIVLLVWVFFLGYEILFFDTIKSKETFKKAAKILLMAVFSIILYYIILNIITFVRTKEIIGLKDVFLGQNLFMNVGYFMIKMKLIHPWILVVLIYAISLAITIKNLKFMNKKNETNDYEKNTIIFSLAILGMGLFSYYQGRSHDEVLYKVTYPAIILLGIFLDMAIQKCKQKSKLEKIHNSMIIVILTTVLTTTSMSTILYLVNNRKMLDKNYISSVNILNYNIENLRKVKEIVKDAEFMLKYDSYYYVSLKMKDNRKICGYEDLFRYEDYEKILDYLEENDILLYTNNKVFNILNDKYYDRIQKLLEGKYTLLTNDANNSVIFINEANLDKIEELKNLIYSF